MKRVKKTFDLIMLSKMNYSLIIIFHVFLMIFVLLTIGAQILLLLQCLWL